MVSMNFYLKLVYLGFSGRDHNLPPPRNNSGFTFCCLQLERSSLEGPLALQRWEDMSICRGWHWHSALAVGASRFVRKFWRSLKVVTHTWGHCQWIIWSSVILQPWISSEIYIPAVTESYCATAWSFATQGKTSNYSWKGARRTKYHRYAKYWSEAHYTQSFC